MARFIIRRLLGMIPFILLVSFTVFVLIKLPPGDFVSNYAANLSASGETVNEATLIQMRQEFGLNQPFLVAVLGTGSGAWCTAISAIRSSGSSRSASLIGERLGLTLVLSVSALFFTWAVALPIGVFSAVRRYSIADYVCHVHKFSWALGAGISAGPGADVCRRHGVRGESRRAFFAALPECAVVAGADARPAAALVDPDGRSWAFRARPA